MQRPANAPAFLFVTVTVQYAFFSTAMPRIVGAPASFPCCNHPLNKLCHAKVANLYDTLAVLFEIGAEESTRFRFRFGLAGELLRRTGARGHIGLKYAQQT